EKLTTLIESINEPSNNHLLLKGETLVRAEKIEEGVALIKDYLSQDEAGWKPASETDGIKQLFPGHIDRSELVIKRLSLLPEESFKHAEVTFLYCDTAVMLEQVKQAVQALERLAQENTSSIPEIISWIESDEDVSLTAPAQKLLARLYIESGDSSKAETAVRITAEMDPSQIPTLTEMIESALKESQSDDPRLRLILAELHARGGDSESAEEILNDLESEGTIDNNELFRLTSEIMKHCGISLGGVVSSIDISIRNGDVSTSLPYVVEFCRENTDAHEELAGEIRKLTQENENFWPAIAELADSMAEQEPLTKPFRSLQALSHLENGEVERAVFEYDQLLMLDDEFRLDLIRIYEKAVERYKDNTTLNLALYQLHLEEEQLALAAKYLCRTLKIDPGQIRDVMTRFNQLVEKESDNRGIWEEMLKTSISMKHLSLARETLSRAVSMLPQDESAALHIYGARISAADGNSEDGLRCIAMTLTSSRPDLGSIEEE
ncbi:MAG: hypothetical protein KAX38_04320, partial [Candidatus Krumholzibacteria bacterium]|nr:hypothetical protein [Candidatus Krumholzibacteria bacterium]